MRTVTLEHLDNLLARPAFTRQSYKEVKVLYETWYWEQNFRWEHGDFGRYLAACKKANKYYKLMETYPEHNTNHFITL